MQQSDTTVMAPDKSSGDSGGNRPSGGFGGGDPPGDSGGGQPSGGRGGRGAGGSVPASGGGFFAPYKPEQGITLRRGSFIGGGLIVTWGSWFLYDQLRIYEGDDLGQMLITPGIPILFAVVLGAIVWRLSFVKRSTSDFLIATEGEMKKVSWSSKREVIGSTKVVIVFTLLMAMLLFTVDTLFQGIFVWIGVLKKGP